MLEQELRTLKSLRQLLFDGLFDHSGPGESNERVGFGDVYVAEHRMRRRDTTGRRVGQDGNERDRGLMKAREHRRRNLFDIVLEFIFGCIFY